MNRVRQSSNRMRPSLMLETLVRERTMARVRVHNFTISLDGYGAGPRQSLEKPLGVGAEALHEWYIATRAFRRMHGESGGSAGIDDDIAARFGEGIGAWIMGRNMFGPIRGPWPDDAWHGWWGKDPPYHGPVFVLTNHGRPPIPMEGGTVFHFVRGGIREALERATAAAKGKDVQIGGGVSTIRQYLEASLIDELHLAIAPRLLGSGEHLLHGLDLPALGYECTSHVPTAAAMHVVLTKTSIGGPSGLRQSLEARATVEQDAYVHEKIDAALDLGG